jgi:hypothetical protein
MTRSVYDPDMPEISVPPQVVRLGAAPVQPQLFEQPASYVAQEQQE